MNNNQQTMTPRSLAEQNYKSARNNLLLVIVLTVVNIVLMMFGSQAMMLFSATVPYMVALLGYISENTTVLVLCLAFAAIFICVYLLCWLLSKNNGGWMIAALVFFSIDTLAMVGLYVLAADFSGILDVVIHALVLYYLIMGVVNWNKLKKLPPDPPVIPVEVKTEDTSIEE